MTALLRFCLLVFAVTLTACGGSSGGSSGGGGGGSNGGDDITVPDDGGGVPEDGLAGRAAKGAIHSATVEASLWDGHGWTTLETTSTNSEGYFGLDIGAESAPVRILVTATPSSQMRCDAPAGCQGRAFGEFMTLPEGFQLSTIVPGDAIDPDGEIAVTALTHIAARWTQEMPGGPTNAGAELALSRVAELFGLASDFALRLPVDVSVSNQLAEANDEDARHGLLSAAFAELAGQSGQDIAELLDGAAQMFSLLGGQVLLQSGELTAAEIEELILDLGGDPQELLGDIDLEDLAVAGLDALLASAISVANHVNQSDQLDALIADFNAMSVAIGDDLLSQLVGSADYNETDFDRAMVVLDELDFYLDLADSLAPTEGNSFAWLYESEQAIADTEGAITALAEALEFAVQGFGMASVRRSSGFCSRYNLETNEGTCGTSGYALLERLGSLGSGNDFRVMVSGDRHGQSVDLTFNMRHALELIAQESTEMTIVGSISNGTSVLELDMTLGLDLSGNDMTALQTRAGNISLADIFNYQSFVAELEAEVDELMQRLHVEISLGGGGEFVRVADSETVYSFSGMDLEILYNTCAVVENTLCLINDGPVFELVLGEGENSNAAGDTRFALAGQERLRLTIDDPAEIDLHYGVSHGSGFPAMEYHLNGVLAGSEALLEQIGAIVGDVPEAGEIDYEALFAELAAKLDLDLLGIEGNAQLVIEHPVDGQQAYNLTVSEGAFNVSLPNSSEVALSVRVAGAAGYIYAGQTLVATLHPTPRTDGLLLALVSGEGRSYSSAPLEFGNPDDYQALIDWLTSLYEEFMAEE